jgi:hypothetical protein
VSYYGVVQDVAASWDRYAGYAAALAEAAPLGLILSAAGPTDEGFRIIELWDSETAWTSFRSSRPVPFDHSAAPVIRTLELAHVVARSEAGR